MTEVAEKTTDSRQKVDHNEVLRLKKEGVKPTEIATRYGVAVGTVYKILREKGEGSGRTLNRASKGVNVSAELDSTIERLQSRVDSLASDIAAEKERHSAALALISAEADKAKGMLTSLDAIRKSVADEVTDNGDAPASEPVAEAPAKSGGKK